MSEMTMYKSFVPNIARTYPVFLMGKSAATVAVNSTLLLKSWRHFNVLTTVQLQRQE